MATPKSTIHLTGLARCLVSHNIISEEDAANALKESKRQGDSFINHLIQQGLSSGHQIAGAAAKEFGLPLVDIDAIDLESAPISLIEEKLIQRYTILPLFKRGNRLFLAVSDPTSHQTLDEIKFHTGLATEAVVAAHDKLKQAIAKSLEAATTDMEDLLDDDLGDLDFADDGGDAQDDAGDLDVDEAPIVKFVNKIMLDGIHLGVSDIHFEPYEKYYRIRYRQDGMLSEVTRPPLNITSRLTSRIKVMSRMNIAERRVPQDGRIKMILSKTRSIDFRVNTCPTLYGEKIVMRILDPASANLGIEKLGFEEEQQKAFLSAIQKPYGMILVTGPTGSGKTVSLYTGLNILNQPGVNISTVEDPVEIPVAGLNQVNQNTKTGLTFAEALRSFLRQDPDIVMVGEIRDLETAEIAVKAAQTGHLVLSTLHTNDAPQTLSRLANMGVPPFNIASAVNLIMAQRLARRLCENCKEVEDVPAEALIEEGFTEEEIEDGLTIYKPVGCNMCKKGYKGRVGVYQVMPVSEEMGRIIMENGNSIQLADQARVEGIDDLRQSGLRKVKAGIIGLDELNRITKD